MDQPENPFSIGETHSILYPDQTKGVATLIEIIPLPKDPEEKQKTLDQVYNRLQIEPNIAMIAGANLADDSALTSRVDPNALYIFES